MKYQKVFVVFAALPLLLGTASATTPLAGMPPVLDQNDIYAADRPNQ